MAFLCSTRKDANAAVPVNMRRLDDRENLRNSKHLQAAAYQTQTSQNRMNGAVMPLARVEKPIKNQSLLCICAVGADW